MKSIELPFKILFFLFLFISTYYFLVPLENVGPGIPHFDKVAHFGVFFVLSGLLTFGFKPTNKTVYILAFCYGLAVELTQGLLAYRSASVPDLVADMLGVIAFVYLQPKIQQILIMRNDD